MHLPFISEAFAVTQTSAKAHSLLGGQEGGGSALSPLFLLLIFAVFIYFFLIRPQTKRMKEQKSLLDSLKMGDEVITTGGLVGKINKIEEQFIKLAIANDVEVVVQKPAVSGLLPKGTIKS